MQKLILLTLCGLTVLGLQAPIQLRAQETRLEQPAVEAEKPIVRFPFRGKLGAVDPEEMTIGIAGRERVRTIHITKTTRIVRYGKPAKLEDAKIGEEVGGLVMRTADGKEEAVSLRLGPKDPPDSD